MNPSNDLTAGNPGSAPAQGLVSPIKNPQATIATIPLPIQTTAIPPVQPQAGTSTTQVTGYQVADDKDIIEPQWIHKAQEIVKDTIEDPYKQSEDLTVLKADYMQKRYNKIVKLK